MNHENHENQGRATVMHPVKAAIRRLLFKIYKPIWLLRQRLCKHILGPDTGGFVGSGYVDRWCKKCGKGFSIHKDEGGYEAK